MPKNPNSEKSCGATTPPTHKPQSLTTGEGLPSLADGFACGVAILPS